MPSKAENGREKSLPFFCAKLPIDKTLKVWYNFGPPGAAAIFNYNIISHF